MRQNYLAFNLREVSKERRGWGRRLGTYQLKQIGQLFLMMLLFISTSFVGSIPRQDKFIVFSTVLSRLHFLPLHSHFPHRPGPFLITPHPPPEKRRTWVCLGDPAPITPGWVPIPLTQFPTVGSTTVYLGKRFCVSPPWNIKLCGLRNQFLSLLPVCGIILALEWLDWSYTCCKGETSCI